MLTGRIDRLEWDGNTVMPDDHILITSTKLVDASNRQAIWSQNLHKFKSELKTKSIGKSVADVFLTRIVSNVAESLSNEVAEAIGRQE